MDFNKARTFVEVIDRNGISAAASYMNRTQQAISSQITSLESDMGIALLTRQGPTITFTADGERLYTLFKAHLVSIENEVQHLKADKTKSTGVIRIGAWLEGATHHLPKLIAGFSKKFPLVTFEIIIGTDDELEAMLMANKIDVSIQLFVNNVRAFHKTPAVYEDLIPIVSKAYADKEGVPGTIAETLDMPIVDFHFNYSIYPHWIKTNEPKLFHAAQKKTALVCVSNILAIKSLVRQNLGMGFLSRSTIQNELASGELLELAFRKPAQNKWVEFDIVYKRQNSLGFIHKAFVEHVVEHRIVPNKPSKSEPYSGE